MLILLSYCHADGKLKDELVAHLSAVGQGTFALWTDDLIAPGDDWKRNLEYALSQANMALLLLSADYLTSRFINDIEVPRLLQRSTNEGLPVIPIVLRHCAWRDHPFVGRLQALPRSGKPVARYSKEKRNEVFLAIAEDVRAAWGSWRRKTPPPPPTFTSLRTVPGAKPPAPSRGARHSSFGSPEHTQTATAPSLVERMADAMRIYGSACLLVVAAPERTLLGRAFVLPDATTDDVLIGRSVDCTIILQSERVSRSHARLTRSTSGQWTIADTASTHGTFHNELKVGVAHLKPGDIIEVGAVKFKFISGADIQEQCMDELYQLTRTDQETGLLKARVLWNEFESSFDPDTSVNWWVASIGIDQYSEMVNHYGTDVLKKAVVEIAREIEEMWGATAQLARCSVDEILVIYRAAGTETGRRQAEALHLALATRVAARLGHRLRLSISLGIAAFGDLKEGLDQTLSRARENLRSAQGAYPGWTPQAALTIAV